jgi:hypothetical protein
LPVTGRGAKTSSPRRRLLTFSSRRKSAGVRVVERE